MRVGVDANLSWRIAEALNALYAPQPPQQSLSFECVGAGPADSDAPWIAAFAESGGNAFLGLDKRILSKPHEVQALEHSGLGACFFDIGRRGAKLHFQAACVIHWWPRLQQVWAAAPQSILRVKAEPRLSWQGLEQLRYEVEDGRPIVRHEAYRPADEQD